jgi:hypothetical protein
MGCSFGHEVLRLFFAGCSVANCFLHNLLGKAMRAKRQLSVAVLAEKERALISTRTKTRGGLLLRNLTSEPPFRRSQIPAVIARLSRATSSHGASMDRHENDLSELDLNVLTFDLPDEALERAAADHDGQAITIGSCTHWWYCSWPL